MFAGRAAQEEEESKREGAVSTSQHGDVLTLPHVLR